MIAREISSVRRSAVFVAFAPLTNQNNNPPPTKQDLALARGNAMGLRTNATKSLSEIDD